MSIITGVGSPGTVASASGGKVTGFNTLDATTPVVVAAANPQRAKIVFHAPGDADVLVYPVIGASGAANTPTLSARGGGFVVFAGATLEISGECQGAWSALAVGGSSNKPLTVMDSNVP